MQRQRDRPDRPDVCGDVLASLSVTARSGLDQLTALVTNAHREPVKLELAKILDLFARLQASGSAQRIRNALVEGAHLVIVESVAKRQHGYGVCHAAECRQRRRADALSRRRGSHEIRMGVLEILQLAHQAIVVRIRHDRIIQDVIGVIVPIDLRTQPGRALCRRLICRHRGCRQENTRRARWLPAFNPAASSWV